MPIRTLIKEFAKKQISWYRFSIDLCRCILSMIKIYLLYYNDDYFIYKMISFCLISVDLAISLFSTIIKIFIFEFLDMIVLKMINILNNESGNPNSRIIDNLRQFIANHNRHNSQNNNN